MSQGIAPFAPKVGKNDREKQIAATLRGYFFDFWGDKPPTLSIREHGILRIKIMSDVLTSTHNVQDGQFGKNNTIF